MDGGVPFPSRARDVSLLHSIQTGSRSNQLPIKLILGALSTGTKQPRGEANHSLLFTAQVKNDGAIPPLPHTSSWHGV
jgi:hypothetical protein